MDWPSRELSQCLAEWRLCTPQDLQRCRGAVCKFVRDLPSFDSVWIDVLLQNHLLTPYQARILDSSTPDRLALAGHVIQDCLEENAWRGVYRARSLEGNERRLLTVHGLHPDERVSALQSIDSTIARLRGVTHPGLAAPLRAEVGGRELIVESANVDGTPLRELLIRRGRFPAAVTGAIARSLTPILSILEERDVAHGDLRPRNVWLDDQGGLHVLNAGVLAAVMPTFRVMQELPVEVCDGMDAEVASSGRAPDARSDQYALGCLLWQLAAGRPPFPTGDAHGKIAAHRSRPITDVRELAPQTPDTLAGVIRKLTQRSPVDRYATFREMALQIGPPAKADRKLLKRFFHTFQTEAPTQTAREVVEHSRQLPSTLAAVVISSATLWLFTSPPASIRTRSENHAAVPPRPLPADSQARPIGGAAPVEEPAVIQTAGVRQPGSAIQTLPIADPTGVIVLTPGATYLAQNVRQPGPLVIRGADGGIARLIVRDTVWEAAADSVRLENVQLECHSAVRLQCRGLEIIRSVVSSGAGSATPAIEWRPQDSAAATPGTITMIDSHFPSSGLQCVSRPAMIRIANCLKTGPGAFLQIPPAGRAHQSLPVHLIHMTLRESGPLVAWTPGPRAAGQRIDVVTKACVFAPAPETPLFALAGSIAPAEWERSLSISGLESLLQGTAKLVDLVPPPGKPRGAIDTGKLDVDGLQRATIEFFGDDVQDVASNGLKSTDAQFLVDNPPGINIEKVARRLTSH
ncbi:Serine/threonine-protein kinase PrkC [Caulifigura coniformis]|uniref:Serine/threonine-protein kinase PrkC n=1 Tax=Caulifigura coniformis TaxID=2527983 RepID=A0A517SKE8_9PLAN|nr:protein kinase [Caulifigura coniformis]QDT56600.1 Serine/threonine-protein kinase PrkC [Caulifigura coniformis]